MAQPLAAPYSYFADANGDPLSGGLIYTYLAGTTTPKATYTDAGATTPLPNPVVLDSAGRAQIWLVGNYKIVVKDALGVTISTADNITASGASGDMTKAVYDPANIQEQLVGLSAVQLVTNKKLQDSTTTFVDNSDNTKAVRFQISTVSTGTTREATWPNKDGTVAFTSDINNILVQTIGASSTAQTSCGQIPLDNTKPQITEGTEVLTVSITPTNASNKLIIDADINWGEDANVDIAIAALFKDSGADALQVVVGNTSSGGISEIFNSVSLHYEMTAGGTASTTFRIRIGGASGNIYLNKSGAITLGGAMSSWIRVREQTQ